MKKAVLFTAPWCAPCQTLKPLFEEVKGYLKNVDFEEVCMSKDMDRARAESVMSVPTLVVYENGQQINRRIGLVTKQHIIDTILEY